MINRLFYNFITKLLIVIIEHVNKQDMKYREEILLVELLLKKERALSPLSLDTYIDKLVNQIHLIFFSYKDISGIFKHISNDTLLIEFIF